jgi:signal transduction histidine kinase
METEASPHALVLGQELLDAAPIGMALLDADQGRVVWVNRAFATLVDARRPALVGSLWSDVTGAGLPQGVDGQPEEQTWHVGSSQRVVSVQSVTPVETPGYVVHQVLDVTELHAARQARDEALEELQARNAELERSNEDLTQFAYVASHDLSEPLRVIAGHVQLLADRYRGQLDSDADRWIEFAVDGATRMRVLIEDLLRYSRAGRELRRESVPLEPLFRTAMAQVSFTQDVEFRLPGPLPTVEGDPSQLDQVVSNLVSNAVKFVPEGTRPVVEVTGRRTERGWRCEVSDNGPGIDPRYRERAFRVFQRLHSRAVPGTGIGLAICRRIVQEHGGWMDISDSPLGGATVAFELPS